MYDSEDVSITAFGHFFQHLNSEHAAELRSLQDEGLIYSYFADYNPDGAFAGKFTRYCIRFKPLEIFEFVEAHVARQQYIARLLETDDFDEAVSAIADPKYRARVRSHAQRIGPDNIGCYASFVSADLESLLCGGKQHRYEMADLADVEEKITRALNSVTVSARRLGSRRHNRPPLLVENEYDIQDLVEIALRAVFDDVAREDPTPMRPDGNNRVDLSIPSANAIIECKFVRRKSDIRVVADQFKN
jgi:hypothetical protein